MNRHAQMNDALNTMAGIMVFAWIIGMMLFIGWIICLIDVIRSDFENPSNKTMWLLLLIFVAPIGATLYPILGREQKQKIWITKEEYQQEDINPEKQKHVFDKRITKPASSKDTGKEKWF